MSYTVRSLDYINTPDEPEPVSLVEDRFDDLEAARQWLRRQGEKFQRTDMGRYLTISDAGGIVEEIDQPPCNDLDDDS